MADVKVTIPVTFRCSTGTCGREFDCHFVLARVTNDHAMEGLDEGVHKTIKCPGCHQNLEVWPVHVVSIVSVQAI